MQVFKSELQQALADPSQPPDDELSEAVEYTDGSDEVFLRPLWGDLYRTSRFKGPQHYRAVRASLPSEWLLTYAARLSGPVM